MPGPYNVETTGVQLTEEFAPLIKGKTILTTGVSPNSLGAHFLQTIAAAKPALLILAGRNLEKIQQTADALAKAHPDVKTKILQLDLGSFAPVRKAAEEVNSWTDVPAIDVLVNSAGIMAVPYKLSPDGYESHFAGNHLGHFLFTNLIIDKILKAPAPRIVNISSLGHAAGWVRFQDLNYGDGEFYDKWTAYGQSKSANMLFSLALAEKLGKRGLLSYSVHPGTIYTGLGSHLDLNPDGDIVQMQRSVRSLGYPDGWKDHVLPVSYDQGIATHVFASFSPELKDHNGAYLLESRVADHYTDIVAPWAVSSVEAQKLWKLSEKIVGQEFKY